jgi:diguanylate cyclase (GGDEF)-like protein/PAS domain S-box-containing protein
MSKSQLTSLIEQLKVPSTYWQVLSVAFSYWLTGKLCLIYPFIPPSVSLIWLPAGIAVAALLRGGSVISIGIFIGALLLNFQTGIGLQASIFIAFGNTIGACFIFFYLKRHQFHTQFSHNPDVFHFLLSTIFGTSLSAIIGSLSLWNANIIPTPTTAFLNWWAGDMAGVFLLTPLLLSCTRIQISKLLSTYKAFLLFLVVFLILHWLVFFSQYVSLHRSFITIIITLWAAFRFGSFGASLAALMSACISIVATFYHVGPFYNADYLESYTVIWLYLVSLSVVSLLISTLQTERSFVISELNESYERIQKVASRLPGVILQYRFNADKTAEVLYASEAIFTILEVTSTEIRNDFEKLLAKIDSKDIDRYIATLKNAYILFIPYQIEFRFHRENGEIRWLYIDAIPEKLPKNECLWHCFLSDITERKLAEEHLHIAAITFESQVGTFVTDENWKILKVNKAYSQITGYEMHDILGKYSPRHYNEKQDEHFYKTIELALIEKHCWQGELWNFRKNADAFPMFLTITAIINDIGATTHFVGTFTDMSLNKGYEDEILNLAFYDSLTQLPNRRLLMDRLQQIITLNQREGGFSAIYFIDLDNFKIINDTHGHDAGDILLIEAARRLQTCIRDSDTVARLGGDEFVVVINSLGDNADNAMIHADRIGEKIRGLLCEPYELADFIHHGSGSIGVCLFQGNEVTVKDLFKRADTAMYEAKTSGRNTIRFFDPAMQAVLVVRMMLESNLRNALMLNQFSLHYQIQVDVDGKILGAEALLRWIHPDRGFISPLEFIPHAEQSGLIVPIGLWVMRTACAQLQDWAATPSTEQLSLAVNVSAKQFKQVDFVDSVIEIINQYNFNISRLKIELTESAILDNVDDTTEKMHQLKKIGIGFSMDDFGTGYSSLAYLQKLPLNQLKIDQSFIRDINNDENDATIVKTIISLGNNLGLHVIAEGVETIEQRQFLIDHQCRAFQGYLYSKPLAIKDLNILLSSPPENHPFLNQSPINLRPLI